MPGLTAPLTDETDLLLAYLEQQRDALRIAAHGLTDDELRLVPTAGALSIGGLLKHVAACESGWMDLVEGGGGSDDQGFALDDGDTVESLLAGLDAARDRTERIVRSIGELGHPVPVPKGVPWFPQDVEAWSLRWVLLHLIEEIAKHAGHADIVRESIDGATFYELMAAHEGWPVTDWLRPWERAAA